jgi:urease alpha subunit
MVLVAMIIPAGSLSTSRTILGLPATALVALCALGCGQPARNASIQPAHTAAPASLAAAGASADMVLRGGEIHTMDRERPRATAIAVRAGTIVAVGSDAEIAPWIGASTEVVALDGRSVTPGLVDAHCHVLGGTRHRK